MKTYLHKKYILVLSILFIGGMLFSQTVLYHEEFDGGLGDWQTIGFQTDNAPAYDYENNIWKWEADGTSNGQFRIKKIDSESVSNGAALFDAESYHRSENNGELPTGPPYPDLHAELISPVYDISSAERISFQWTQVLSELINSIDEYAQASYSYKLDGGTWSEATPLRGLEANSITKSETMTIHLPELQGASTLQIKFIHYQSFYYWLIDDVKILDMDIFSDLKVSNIFITPSYFMTPKDMIKHDTFFFHFETTQLGNVVSNTPQAEISVKNKQTSEVVFSQSSNLAPLLISNGVTRKDSLVETYAPGDLPVGTYVIEYKINDPNLTESNPDNNSYSYEFKVTEELFGLGDEINGIPFTTQQNDSSGFYVGVLFHFPEEYTGEYVWNGFTTSYDIVGTPSSIDYNYTLYYSKLNYYCDSYRDGPFSGMNMAPPENDLFTILGKTEFSTVDYPIAEAFVVPLLDKDTGEPLTEEERTVEKGNCYVFWIYVPDESLDVGIATTYEVYGPEQKSQSWRPTIYDTGREAYFYGGWDGKRTPAMQPSIQYNAVSNVPELPERTISLFPIPASDRISAEIKLDNPTDITVIISDMQGTIKSISVESNITQAIIQRDISELPAGSYIFRIVTNEGSQNIPFIKQ